MTTKSQRWICDCRCDCETLVEWKQHSDSKPALDVLCDDCWEGEHTWTDAGTDDHGDARREPAS